MAAQGENGVPVAGGLSSGTEVADEAGLASEDGGTKTISARNKMALSALSPKQM